MLIYAVGSQMSSHPSVRHRSGHQMKNGWSFFQPAWRLFGSHRLINSTYTLDDATISLLASIYLMGAGLPSPCWVLSGVTSRIVMDLGLHRRMAPVGAGGAAGAGYGGSGLYRQEVEARNRLFWGWYMVDRIMALTCGRPVSILDEDCDVELPGAVDGSGAVSQDSLAFFRASVAVVKNLNEVVQHGVRGGRGDEEGEKEDMEMMRELDSRLRSAWETYPCLRPVQSQAQAGVGEAGKNSNAWDPLEPSTLKLLFVAQHARLALFSRHFTDSSISASMRGFCVRKSIEVARQSASVLRRCAAPGGFDGGEGGARESWEARLRRGVNDVVCCHIGRAGIVLLLALALRSGDGGHGMAAANAMSGAFPSAVVGSDSRPASGGAPSSSHNPGDKPATGHQSSIPTSASGSGLAGTATPRSDKTNQTTRGMSRDIVLLWKALRAAATAHVSAAKNLEIFCAFADTLNVDLESLAGQCERDGEDEDEEKSADEVVAGAERALQLQVMQGGGYVRAPEGVVRDGGGQQQKGHAQQQQQHVKSSSPSTMTSTPSTTSGLPLTPNSITQPPQATGRAQQQHRPQTQSQLLQNQAQQQSQARQHVQPVQMQQPSAAAHTQSQPIQQQSSMAPRTQSQPQHIMPYPQAPIHQPRLQHISPHQQPVHPAHLSPELRHAAQAQMAQMGMSGLPAQGLDPALMPSSTLSPSSLPANVAAPSHLSPTSLNAAVPSGNRLSLADASHPGDANPGNNPATVNAGPSPDYYHFDPSDTRWDLLRGLLNAESSFGMYLGGSGLDGGGGFEGEGGGFGGGGFEEGYEGGFGGVGSGEGGGMGGNGGGF
jgi:hypothetical protein